MIKIPEYDFSLYFAKTMTIKAKNKHIALEEAKELMKNNFYNELDLMEVKEK